MSDNPYSAVMRKEPRSPLLVALAVTLLLTGALLLMWSRGWLDFRPDGSVTRAKAPADTRAATATCEQAADRYTACMGELLGESAKELASSKRDVQSCASDPKTVAMYEECLPKSGCQPFLDCMTAYAMKTAP